MGPPFNISHWELLAAMQELLVREYLANLSCARSVGIAHFLALQSSCIAIAAEGAEGSHAAR